MNSSRSVATVFRALAMPIGLGLGGFLGIVAGGAHAGAAPMLVAGLLLAAGGVALRAILWLTHRDGEIGGLLLVSVLLVAGMGLGLIVLGLTIKAS